MSSPRSPGSSAVAGAIAAIVCLLARPITAADRNFALQSAAGSVSINPASLEMTLSPGGKSSLALSLGQTNLGPVASFEASASQAKWRLPERQAEVSLALSDEGLLVHIGSEKPGGFTFPIIQETAATKAWVLPLFEGVYVPAGDPRWRSFLTNYGEMSTTADFTLPFIALDQGDATLTCIITNPFNNRVTFALPADGHLQARLTHEFTRNHPVKEYAVLFQVGKASPIEPARLYRRWLVQRGEFVSLKQKIQKTPEAEKLLGAAHAYLWGDELVSTSDILDWKRFAGMLLDPSASPNPPSAKKIWDLLQPATRAAVTNLAQAQWPDKYTKSVVLEDLNRLLVKPDFCSQVAAQTADERPGTHVSQAEICRRNCALLAAAVFPGLLAKPETWGNGLSPKMVHRLAEAGFDRFWLGNAAWDGFVNRPETVAAAKSAGFLIGPYDSYNGIHSPKEADTWETSQFDLKLYETGPIVNADGTKRHGFKGKGYQLSPDAARPYVEKRVSNLMDSFHANSWFIDCDGFGEFLDDYSPAHPATQQSDMQARIARMAWIRDTFGAVIGTEGCSAGVAPAVHFAHGVMTPVIGWGDPDLNAKQSPYYLGSYYPPDEPQVFFKPVPIKKQYRYLYFDPRFRLPLFQAVFHDSVVATHHWSFGSFKAKDQARTVELLELLYNVPPLYHLNLQEFEKRQGAIKRHYDFFSPLHRRLALLPLTDFKWLTPDHLVQQATFGDEVDLVANFSAAEFAFENGKLGPNSVLAKWRKTGQTQAY